MKAVNVNPRMFGLVAGVDTLKFYEVVGRDAEFVYGVTPWVPELVELRAGGLIPIARQYPGAQAHEKGGVLGRSLELVVYDDASDSAHGRPALREAHHAGQGGPGAGAVRKRITDSVANVTEKHKMPMVAPQAGATSIL